jgi:two-component system, sporulation sensor kinase E
MKALSSRLKQNAADGLIARRPALAAESFLAAEALKRYVRMLLLVGGGLLILAWLHIYHYVGADYERTIAETARETMNLAQAFEEHVRRVVGDNDEHILSIKRAYELNGAGSPVLAAFPRAGGDPIQSMAMIVNERGEVTTSFSQDCLDDDVSGRQYFRVHRDVDSGSLYIGTPIIGRAGSEPVIPMSRRINKADGSFGGIVYISLRANYFLSFYQNIDLGRDRMVTLLGTDGIIRARITDDDWTMGMDVRRGESWWRVQGQPYGSYFLKSVIDGKVRMISHRAMSDYPLIVVVGKSQAVALADYEKRRQEYILGGVAVSLLIVLVGYLLINRMRVIQRSEASFQKIFLHSPAMMAILGLYDRRYVEVNQKFLDVLGYSRSELIGHTPEELSLLDEPAGKVQEWIAKSGEAPYAEQELRTKSGKTVVVLATAALVEIGGKSCRLDIMQDITAEKQAERERVRMQKRFQTFFDQCPTAMVLYWADSRKIIDVNPAYEQLHSVSKAELVGKAPEELGICQKSIASKEGFGLRLKAAGAIREEADLGLADGRHLRVIMSAAMLDGDEAGQVLASMVDITDLRRMEAELVRMDQLNLVGEMAAGLGHEVRNPMTTVRGYLQLFQQRGEFSRYHKQLATMVEELDRANGIISEYLSLAKNRASELKQGNLNEALRMVLPLLQADGLLSGHAVGMYVKPVPDILFDEKELRQLVINLVRNGLEATPAGGVVTIETFPEKGKVVLAIRDEGGGIPDDIVKRIGTPFLTTKDGGTGLGLSICYRIAERHNAKIDFTTGKEGTTFYIRFPAA